MTKDAAMNSKDDGNTMYTREPEISTAEAFKRFLYNSETGACLGRTGASWAKILIFYVIFYVCLSIMFGICMTLFLMTLNEHSPKWALDDGLIGTSPGLGFRPMLEGQEESAIVWYNATAKDNYKNWTTSLEDFLQEYRVKNNSANVVRCDYNKPPPSGKVCSVDVDKWFPCTLNNNFNYPRKAPCVFIKLNKIFNWIPDYYNETASLPDHMPEELKKYIASQKKINSILLNTVWVSCEGENPADKENIGSLKYLPQHGFPGYYYPYTNTPNYASPLVAIVFQNITRSVLVNVECRAWAKNIVHDRKDQVGMVHFEMMVDY